MRNTVCNRNGNPTHTYLEIDSFSNLRNTVRKRYFDKNQGTNAYTGDPSLRNAYGNPNNTLVPLLKPKTSTHNTNPKNA